MSDFGKPVPCRNQCGAYIYFDRDSEIGHPSSDKWIPLVFEKDTGVRTDTPHQCPKSTFTKQAQQAPQQTQQTPQQQNKSTTIVTEPTSMKIINAKLDRIIALLESQKQT